MVFTMIRKIKQSFYRIIFNKKNWNMNSFKGERKIEFLLSIFSDQLNFLRIKYDINSKNGNSKRTFSPEFIKFLR